MVYQSMMKRFIWKVCVITVALVEYCAAQNSCEPNVAGIVVGSVFGTLAVVALVLGVIAFLLWRRNRALKSTPKKTRKVNSSGLSEDHASPQHEGHINPGFTDNHPDISAAEAGFAGYVPCDEYVPNTDRKKSPVSKDDKRKTWTSLPQSDIPEILQRHGSCGSLDDNYLNSMDPEVISVCLQSQDFIGLGFNISGNMRDGIYVSTVHNRGPAIESGRVKVGDRIKSVTISFESMVYEDALTILSYASPYPVKVTLQKEKVAVHDRRVSDSNENLSHPLYRSQSLDALQRIGREPHFKPKRTQSEMKPETRKDSTRAKRLEELANEALDIVEGSDSQSSTLNRKSKQEKVVDFSSAEDQVNMMVSDVTVHKTDEGQQKSGLDFPDIGIPNIDFVEKESVFQEQSSKPESQQGSSSSAALEFASLMDQMLDLKESKPEGQTKVQVVNGAVPDVTAEVTTELNTTPKTPTKPQRRKRHSNSTSPNSTMSPDSLIQPEFSFDVSSPLKTEDIVLEDVIVAASAKSVQSAAPGLWGDREEVVEDEIIPEKAKKEIHIGSDNIEFKQREVATSSPVRSPSPPPDVQSFGLSMNGPYRSKSPEGDPVEEELIEAVVAKKDSSAPPPRMFQDEIVPAESSVNFSAPSAAVSVKKKEEKKAPELDEEMLEQIISMNAQPPGTTALQWMNNNDSFEIPDKDRPTSPKGIAYEIRDDIMTGLPRAVDLNKGNVVRTMSYDLKLSDRKDSTDKSSTGSLRDDKSGTSSDRIESLDWSGKRLVRSGSFTDIPHNASGSDWTDKNLVDEGFITIKSDDLSDSDTEAVNKRATDIFTPRQNLASLSDMSDARSPPSSESPSPPANGQSIQITSDHTQLKNNNIEGLQSFEKSFGTNISSDKKGNYSINLTLDGNDEEDVDC